LANVDEYIVAVLPVPMHICSGM